MVAPARFALRRYAGHVASQLPQRALKLLVVADVTGKGGLLAHGFGFVLGHHHAVVFAASTAGKLTPYSPKRRDQAVFRPGSYVADRANAQGSKLPAVLGPTPQSISIGSGARKSRSSPCGTIVSPNGGRSPLPAFLPTSVAILATSLLDAMPMELGSPSSSRISA